MQRWVYGLLRKRPVLFIVILKLDINHISIIDRHTLVLNEIIKDQKTHRCYTLLNVFGNKCFFIEKMEQIPTWLFKTIG